MSKKVLIVTVPDMIRESDLIRLREQAEVEYREVAKIDQKSLADQCADHEYLMLNYDVVKHLDDSFYDHPAVRDLKAISVDITGVDWASPHGAKRKNIPLLNVPHYSTESVAESILCEVLLHSRKRHLTYVDQINGREFEERKGINLAGKTAGVLGLGSIGSRVADLLGGGFGMNVLSWNRSPRPGRAMATLEEIFESAQVVCVCVKTVTEGPDKNVGFVDENLLRRCDGTIIVNLANFQLVDHRAMAGAVERGEVAGYTVEHTDAAVQSPVANLPAVHLSPTDAWLSDESLQSLREIWVGNIIEALAGRWQNTCW